MTKSHHGMGRITPGSMLFTSFEPVRTIMALSSAVKEAISRAIPSGPPRWAWMWSTAWT